jgi:hypothetical protein
MYSGKLGVAEQTEVSPGKWEETVTEVDIVGELVQSTETFTRDDSIHPVVGTTTSVSVLSRSGVGLNDSSDMRYLTLRGERYVIASIVDEHPRQILYLGGKYNGPTPE